MTISAGSMLGPYEILSPLGAGGMGEVYRARDRKLDRDVAIKVLPESMAGDPETLGRFEREAKAVAALSHPNILSIFDFGAHDGRAYAVTELLEGETLRDKIEAGPISSKLAVDYALQIAEGLAAAHERGIVHRDLKPENVFVTRDGHLKILDFGLAKRTESEPGDETSSPTASRHTEPGTVMGTVGYMSPEQVRGLSVDHRSDIFSLGVLLYELLSGRKAFKRDTAGDTIAAILKEEPPELSESGRSIPASLDRIVRHCLEKPRERRFQSARDVSFALAEASGPTAASHAPAPVRAAGRGRILVAAAVIAVAGLALAALLWSRAHREDEKRHAPPTLTMKMVTATGKVIAAAISPDGNYVAYVESDQGEQALWLRQIGGTATIKLIPMRRVAFWGHSFSADGTKIVFGMKSQEAPTGAFYEIPTLGGTPRRLVEGIDSAPAFSRDGKKIAWLRAQHPKPDESALMMANADGTEPRVVAVRKAPEAFVPIFYAGPSWSPDGTRIAASVVNRDRRSGKLVAFRTADGAEELITEPGWLVSAQSAWLPEGDALVAIAQAAQPQQRHGQVWLVPYPKGAPTSITNDLLDYRIVNLTRDGRSLLTVASETRADIWVRDGSSRTRKTTSSRLDGSWGLAFSPDARIVYTSLENGTLGLWSMSADGTDRRTITSDGDAYFDPVAGADGTIFAIAQSPSGANLRSMRPDGTGARTVVRGVLNAPFAVSPDGRWVVYNSLSGGLQRLFRQAVEGGPPLAVAENEAVSPAISPDGRRIAYYYFDPKLSRWRIGVAAFDGTGPRNSIDAEPPFNRSILQWARKGDGLLLNTVPSDRANVWFQPLGGEKPVKVTDFSELTVFGFAASPDGKALALSRGALSRDAVLITGFR